MPLSHAHQQNGTQGHSFGEYIKSHLHLAKTGRKIIDSYHKLNDGTKALIVTHSMVRFAGSLGSLFVIVFLWRQTLDFRIPALYFLLYYLAAICIFFAVAAVPFRVQAKRIIQAGVIIIAIHYLLFIVLQEHSYELVWMFGLLAGIGTGLHWSAHHILAYSSTTKDSRDMYYGLEMALAYITAIITPALGGLLISQIWFRPFNGSVLANYNLLFLITTIGFFVAAFLAVRLPSTSIEPGQAKLAICTLQQKRWQFMSIREIADGMHNGTLGFISAILAFLVLGSSELNLGLFTAVFAFFSAIISIFLGGAIIKKNRDRIHLGYIGASMIAIGRAIYIGLFNVVGIVVSSVISLFAGPLFFVGMAATFYNEIDRSPDHAKHYYAYILIREAGLAVGKILGLGSFILVISASHNALASTKIFYIALSFLPLAFVAITSLLEKQHKIEKCMVDPNCKIPNEK
jgi:YQGE family putative transporter